MHANLTQNDVLMLRPRQKAATNGKGKDQSRSQDCNWSMKRW